MLKIIKDAFTFDDVLIVPTHSDILPHMVNLRTQLTNTIQINIPLVSAAMDTVTESNLAIAIAQEGGLGFIHKNMSVARQVQEVKKVKKYRTGIISDPTTILVTSSVFDLKFLIKKNRFSGYPVVNEKNKLVGIVTNRDIRFIKNMSLPISQVMTPRERLVTVKKNESHEVVLKKMHEHRIEKILMVDDKFHLLGMITAKDLKELKKHPNACKDTYGFLRVGAAVGISTDSEERIDALIAAGIDILLIDSSHGHAQMILNRIYKIRSKYPHLQIIGGNVATRDGAIALVKAGVNAVKVGIGPGSICTTRIVTGVGIPQITAISDVAFALKDTDIPVIADGGIRFSGDIAKAIAAGASCVMVGSMLAGTKEAPGNIEFYKGKACKSYRGMGALSAMSQGSSDRYFQFEKTKKLVPEGVEGWIEYKGNVRDIIYKQMGGLRSSMGLTGCETIEKLRKTSTFVRISNAGMKESHPHDVIIDQKSPNYHIV